MARKRTSRRIRHLFVAIALSAGALAAWGWLSSHPEHNPWAPLDLRDPIGLATAGKMAALKENVEQCHIALRRSEVPFRALPSTGSKACERPDRTQLNAYPFNPNTPEVTCPLAAGLEIWRTKSVEPAARAFFGSDLARIEHVGAYSCRRMYGRDGGPWSEHASANAIDISAFVLADGRRISLQNDWNGSADEQGFLREIRDGACGVFSTVLSPDYNAAHADHFHFDQQSRWSGVCR